MAAGLGFKDFTTGEVLTAADVDGYLMQGVWVFASAAARDAAVTSPQEGNFAYLKDTNVTTYYTGSAWANLDTTGMTNPMTTTGDTIYSSSGSTPARLGIGSTGQVLTVTGGVPTWAAPAGGAGNMAQIATGTLSGASVVVSGLSSYTDLVIFVYGFTNNSGVGNLYLRMNATSTNHDSRGVFYGSQYTPFGYVNTTDFFITEQEVVRTDNQNVAVIKLTNCKNAGFTDAQWNSSYMIGYTSTIGSVIGARGVYTKNEAISSITLRNSGGTWAGGTYTVWGA